LDIKLSLLLPELILVGFALVIVLLDLITAQKRLLVWLSVLGILISAAAAQTLLEPESAGVAFSNMLVVDGFAVAFKFVFLISTLLVVLASAQYIKNLTSFQGEYYALLLLACSGMMLMASAADLVLLYLSLELTGIALAVLAGFLKNAGSAEAGMKFLLLSAISSAVLLYGMAILMGVTGTTNLVEIGAKIAASYPTNRLPVMLSTVLLLAGFGFKMAAVPFQMWVPDVYQGAPTPVTAFLSVASKAAGFAVTLRVFHVALGYAPIAADWSFIFALVSALSMTVGNIVAIQQPNIKRMMGYSSIAQAGYLLVGVAVLPQAGISAVLFFLVSYTVTNLGAFIAIMALSERLGSDTISDYAGAWQRSPFLAICLGICLLSLTGVPPTAGFFAKLFIFSAGIQFGLTWLVILGVVNSVISAYYYVGVVKAMFVGTPKSEEPIGVAVTLSLALVLATAGTFILGVFPAPAMQAVTLAAGSLVP